MKLKKARNVLHILDTDVRQKPYKCGKHWILLETLIYKGYMVFKALIITRLCNRKLVKVTWGIEFEIHGR